MRPAAPNVVQVAPYYPPHLGGVEIVAQTIATSLAAAGRQVEVLTTTCGAAGQPRLERHGQLPGAQLTVAQLTVRRLRGVEIANTPIAPALAGRLLRLPRHCLVHVHIAQAFTPEVVWITSRVRRRPYIAHFHLDVGPTGPAGRLLPCYKRLLLRRVLRGAFSVIVLSAEQRRFVVQRYRVSDDRVVIIPNGVPLGFAGRADRGDRRSAPLRLLFVGRLAPQKNLPHLVEAVRLMRQQAELAIVGDGPALGDLTSLVARHEMDNVRLPGRADRTELGRWYQWADVFVLSSLREGMPLAVLEAMASGLPVVATDVPALRELWADTGMLVPADPLAMAAALDSLATDPARRARLATRSLAAARSAGWDESLRRIEELYRQAMP